MDDQGFRYQRLTSYLALLDLFFAVCFLPLCFYEHFAFIRKLFVEFDLHMFFALFCIIVLSIFVGYHIWIVFRLVFASFYTETDPDDLLKRCARWRLISILLIVVSTILTGVSWAKFNKMWTTGTTSFVIYTTYKLLMFIPMGTLISDLAKFELPHSQRAMENVHAFVPVVTPT